MAGYESGGTETTGFGPDPAMEELFPGEFPGPRPQVPDYRRTVRDALILAASDAMPLTAREYEAALSALDAGEFTVTAAETVPGAGIWRTGRRVGRHIYAQAGPEPSDDDTPVVTVATPELAVALCEAHNALASPAGAPASGAERAAGTSEAVSAPAEPPAGTTGPQIGSEGRSDDGEPF